MLKKLNNDYFSEAKTGIESRSQEALSFNLPISYYLKLLPFVNVKFTYNVFLTYPYKESFFNFKPITVSFFGSFMPFITRQPEWYKIL